VILGLGPGIAITNTPVHHESNVHWVGEPIASRSPDRLSIVG
jgi:hypothetical protein